MKGSPASTCLHIKSSEGTEPLLNVPFYSVWRVTQAWIGSCLNFNWVSERHPNLKGLEQETDRADLHFKQKRKPRAWRWLTRVTWLVSGGIETLYSWLMLTLFALYSTAAKLLELWRLCDNAMAISLEEKGRNIDLLGEGPPLLIPLNQQGWN